MASSTRGSASAERRASRAADSSSTRPATALAPASASSIRGSASVERTASTAAATSSTRRSLAAATSSSRRRGGLVVGGDLVEPPGGGVVGGGHLGDARERVLADGVGGDGQLLEPRVDGPLGLAELVDAARGGLAGRGQLGQAHAQRLLGAAEGVDLATQLDGLGGGDGRVGLALLERAAQLLDLGHGALAGGAELVALAAGLVEPAADLLLLAAQRLETLERARVVVAQGLDRGGALVQARKLGAQGGKLGGALAQLGSSARRASRSSVAVRRVEPHLQRRRAVRAGARGRAAPPRSVSTWPRRAVRSAALAWRFVSSARNASSSPEPVWRASSSARRVSTSAAPARRPATSPRRASSAAALSRRPLTSSRMASSAVVSARTAASSSRRAVDAGAGGLGVAGQVVEAAAVVAGLGALDGDGGELLAQGVGLALDVLDALERGGELGAGGLGLAGAVALEPVERGGELGAGGLRGLLVLGADLLELGDQLGLADVAGGGAAGLDLGEPLFDGARLVGAAAGLLDGLLGAALGLGDGGGQAGVGGGRGLGALALQAVEAGGELGAGGLGDVERAAAVVRGLLGVELGALEPVEAGEQLLVLGGTAGGRREALDLGAQGGGLALGGLGAALGALAGLLELAGQAERDALELVDALHRRQQARHHGGGVVEVGDRVALDARIEVGEAFLDLGVGLGAGGLAAGQLGLHPRGRLQRAEDDERAGRAPALPGLGLGLERLAHRAHDDRVLRSHALEHQVRRELEAEVLEEKREVEALVELDGDEDGLHREVAAVGLEAVDVDAAGLRWGPRRPPGSAATTRRPPARGA